MQKPNSEFVMNKPQHITKTLHLHITSIISNSKATRFQIIYF